MALGIALAAYLGVFKPASEHPGAWFSRSGALITVLSIYAERVLANLIPGLNNAVMKHVRWISAPRQISFWIIVLGTIVWGYGDLLFDALHSAG